VEENYGMAIALHDRRGDEESVQKKGSKLEARFDGGRWAVGAKSIHS
jgi:hypothetical protein